MLDFIVNTYLFGIIPLDVIAHFTVGLILTIVGVRLRMKMSFIFFCIIFLGLMKEYYDKDVLSASYLESFTDILSSVLYPSVFYFYRRFKKSNR